jgi:outer membrane protein TolC
MQLSRHPCWWAVPLVAAAFGVPAAIGDEPPRDRTPPLPPPQKMPAPAQLPAPPPSLLGPGAKPIDLASALRLAGVQNPEILLAREQVAEAVALRQLAAVQFLPTLHGGMNYDDHSGNLQRSTGVIQRVDRSSLYAGLGANAVGAGTVQIPGVVLDGNLSEGIFGALAARQVVRQRRFASIAVRNDVLLQVASAYLELLRAEGRRAIALQIRDDAAELARITADWAVRGISLGRQADANRAAAELDVRNSDVVQAEDDVLLASSRLCELLGLDPAVRLEATDGWVVPVPLVPDATPLPKLIALALTQRPELAERQAAIRAALLRLDSARLLPFSPNYILGYSDGTFGGGSNLVAAGITSGGQFVKQPRFDSFGGRQDFDAVVYWELRNLGLGNIALDRLAGSNLRSEQLRDVEVFDRVRSEVASAYARTRARFAQIETSESGVRPARDAFQQDYLRTFNGVGLPIETLNSLRLLAANRYNYLDAIVDYNRAQFELYVAVGQPPASVLAQPVPTSLAPPPGPPGAPPRVSAPTTDVPDVKALQGGRPPQPVTPERR